MAEILGRRTRRAGLENTANKRIILKEAEHTLQARFPNRVGERGSEGEAPRSPPWVQVEAATSAVQGRRDSDNQAVAAAEPTSPINTLPSGG